MENDDFSQKSGGLNLMFWQFKDLLTFYNAFKYLDDRYWEHFRKEWNAFIKRYPNGLLTRITNPVNIREL